MNADLPVSRGKLPNQGSDHSKPSYGPVIPRADFSQSGGWHKGNLRNILSRADPDSVRPIGTRLVRAHSVHRAYGNRLPPTRSIL